MKSSFIKDHNHRMHISPDTQLPSLPEVALRALDACEEGSYRDISEVISSDPAMVARVLAIANGSLYRRGVPVRSLDQALLKLGSEKIRTLILTAALRQLLFELGADQLQQLRDFWRHSLTTALLARALATLTRYPSEDQAFMIGMLHNVGELIALKQPTAQQQAYLDNQADIGAQLAELWGLGQLAADAIRFQQAPARDIRDASHLVKLINLSSRLAVSDTTGVAAAGDVFGLSEPLTGEILARINREVVSLADSMSVPLSEHYDGMQASVQLRERVIRQVMTEQYVGGLPAHLSGPELMAAALPNLSLLTGCPALLFTGREGQLSLTASSSGDNLDLSVTAGDGSSTLSRAFASGQPSELTAPASVLDQQLLRLLGTRSLFTLPVPGDQEDTGGYYVVGTDTQAPTIRELARLFGQRLRSRLRQGGDQQDEFAGRPLTEAMAREQIRRQVHEISNPLTIVRQYIHQLRAKMQDSQVQGELDIIRQELERAGNLLMQMGDGSASADSDARPVDLNAELEALHGLFEDSLYPDHDIRGRLSLTEEPARVRVPRAALRQVIINLVRNGVEALPGEGTLTLRSDAPVWQQNRRWVELTVEDDGPGLPAEARENLFMPVKTSKGDGHGGLGLSIVKQLIDDMEGIIGCRTGSAGTRFRILLPAATEQDTGQP